MNSALRMHWKIDVTFDTYLRELHKDDVYLKNANFYMC